MRTKRKTRASKTPYISRFEEFDSFEMLVDYIYQRIRGVEMTIPFDKLDSIFESSQVMCLAFNYVGVFQRGVFGIQCYALRGSRYLVEQSNFVRFKRTDYGLFFYPASAKDGRSFFILFAPNTSEHIMRFSERLERFTQSFGASPYIREMTSADSKKIFPYDEELDDYPRLAFSVGNIKTVNGKDFIRMLFGLPKDNEAAFGRPSYIFSGTSRVPYYPTSAPLAQPMSFYGEFFSYFFPSQREAYYIVSKDEMMYQMGRLDQAVNSGALTYTIPKPKKSPKVSKDKAVLKRANLFFFFDDSDTKIPLFPPSVRIDRGEVDPLKPYITAVLVKEEGYLEIEAKPYKGTFDPESEQYCIYDVSFIIPDYESENESISLSDAKEALSFFLEEAPSSIVTFHSIQKFYLEMYHMMGSKDDLRIYNLYKKIGDDLLESAGIEQYESEILFDIEAGDEPTGLAFAILEDSK